MTSLSREFVGHWKTCCACELSNHARSRVIGHGDIPASVLFIGEAPGRVEDLLGRPFVGKSGKLLQSIFNEVETLADCPFTRYLTNVVACCPWNDEHRSSYREPHKDEAESCSGRLAGILEVVRPATIIYVGQVAKRFFKPPKGVPTLTITHPASILRMNVPPESTVVYYQTIHRIKEHLDEVFESIPMRSVPNA